VLAEEKMNDENQENGGPKSPVILTIPACVTAPGYGFLIALNRDWCFEGINNDDDYSRTRRRQVCRSVLKVFDDFWLW
jgi:hypothetical protein